MHALDNFYTDHAVETDHCRPTFKFLVKFTKIVISEYSSQFVLRPQYYTRDSIWGRDP